jgi:P-type E1-E2 ATPase
MLAFDKTGTLTTGELQCVQAECLEGDAAPPAEVLAVAHALERNAVHPVATALVRYAEAAGAPPAKLANFRAIPGSGLEADVLADGTSIKAAVGKPEFINERLDDASARRLLENCEAHRRNGEIVATLYYAEKVYIFAFRDTPREGMRSTLQQLRTEHQLGLLMLTGDHLNSARQVAQELGIDEFYADLKPEDKLDAIASLSKDVGLAMIGDGINDAPALARATAGIAMGQVGSATAMEAADIILLHDNVDHLGWLMSKARLTKRIVKQNLSIALAAIAIASTTALLGVIPLWLAVIMHEGGTVLVGLNGLRLLRG